jgi:hypothetical protein
VRATRAAIVTGVVTLALAAVAVVAVNVSERGIAGGIALAPSDRRWDELMLRGAADADTADLRRGPLVVSDLHGTRWLGTVRGAGWEIRGGRLESVALFPGRLELHGKRTTRWRGALLGLDNHARRDDTAYRFFLLHRRDRGVRAVVVESWDIPASDVVWTQTQGWWHDGVGASLSYDRITTIATVRVTGLTRAFERAVRTAGRLTG